MRVLLAEDDPMIGASIRRGLRQDGFAVDWVEDGRAAEQALSEDVHDVLVLDLGLPKRSGLDVLAAGGVEVNPATREVRLKGEPVAVSPREFALLEALLARPGTILSRTQLEEKLYGWSDPVESNAVEVHIHTLRKKLGAEFIRNVRGVGWMVARSSSI